MKRRIALTVFCALIFVGAYETAAHANPAAKAPTAASFPAGPCDFTHRMDIEIIDGQWFECGCSALTMGWDCAWFALDEPAIAPSRKLKRHHPRGWHLAAPALSRRPA